MRYLRLLLLVAIPIIFSNCSSSLKDKYNKLEKGMTKQQVINLLGEPNQTSSSGGTWLYYDENNNVAFSIVVSGTNIQDQVVVEIGPWRGK